MSYWGNSYMPGIHGATQDLALEFLDLLFPGDTVMDASGNERPKADAIEFIKKNFDWFYEQFEPGESSYDYISPSGGYEFEILEVLKSTYESLLLHEWL